MILVGNKIDMRGGEVTNEALEDEIIPIMNEFKVRRVFIDLVYDLKVFHLGSRDMCRVLSQNAIERV